MPLILFTWNSRLPPFTSNAFLPCNTRLLLKHAISPGLNLYSNLGKVFKNLENLMYDL